MPPGLGLGQWIVVGGHGHGIEQTSEQMIRDGWQAERVPRQL